MTDTRAPSEPDDELLPWRRRGARRTRIDAAPLAAAAPVEDVVPFNNVRRRAATALLASKRIAPHALTLVAADFSAIERVRQRAKLTALPFVARAVVDALREFPHLNATVEGETLVVHGSINIGIAVDLDDEGLVVPVVRGADGMRLGSLAAAFRDLAARARARQLGPDDFAGGTFTITNPGAAGTWISVPILNSPQVGILATDGVAKRVVVGENDSLRIAPLANLCLTFDHRALDGAYAGAFLHRLREIIERRDWVREL